MVNSGFFFSPEIIHSRLASSFPNIKEFDLYNIVEWCGICETSYIKDIDLMFNMFNVPLTVSGGMALLPCNVYRILDVFESSEQALDFKLNSTGTYITSITYSGHPDSEFSGDTIYVNYKGTYVDGDTGFPLIPKGHENACETFCKIRAFEEDVATGKFDRNLWLYYSNQLSGQIRNARQNPYRHKTRSYLKNLEIIRYNSLPKIGKLELAHKQFQNNGIMAEPSIVVE